MKRRAEDLTVRLCALIGATRLGPYCASDDWQTRMHSYSLVGDPARAESGRIDFLQVKRSGNFGNNVIQLINAMVLAEAFGIPEVRHDIDWFRDTSAGEGPHLRKISRVNSGVGLLGTFFLIRANSVLSDTPPRRRARIVDEYLKPAFTLLPEGDGGICLNLRGGADIFDNPSPHRRYGQPPLSYYQTALTHLLERHNDQPLSIVHQDDRNPVLDPLIAWISAQGLTAQILSGGPEADARAILAARHLVIGWTSFSAALALLSPRTESLTIFRAVHMEEVVRLSLPKLWRIEDAAGRYIPATGWRNNARQREAMLTYPAQSLGISNIAEVASLDSERQKGKRIRRSARRARLLTRIGLRRF